MLVKDSLWTIPKMCSEGCATRARPRKQQVASFDNEALPYFAGIVVELSTWIVEVLNSDDRQAAAIFVYP